MLIKDFFFKIHHNFTKVQFSRVVGRLRRHNFLKRHHNHHKVPTVRIKIVMKTRNFVTIASQFLFCVIIPPKLKGD